LAGPTSGEYIETKAPGGIGCGSRAVKTGFREGGGAEEACRGSGDDAISLDEAVNSPLSCQTNVPCALAVREISSNQSGASNALLRILNWTPLGFLLFPQLFSAPTTMI
jgi:hypothetical protein